MKNSFHILTYGIVIVFICLFSACKDEDCPCQDETNPNCENYNPCWNQKPTSADFEMSSILAVTPSWMNEFNPDIAFARGRVGFRALEISENVKYTWKIGSEVIEGRSFVRDFSNTEQTGENDIPVTLIIEKDPNTICFPDDDGKDTMTKYIHFVDNACEFLSNGDFKVLFDGETDSVVVGIRNWYQSSSGPHNHIDDSCSYGNNICIGFDPEKNHTDTAWGYNGATQFNSSIIFVISGGGGSPGEARDGKFEVDPKTHNVICTYKIYRNGLVYSKRYHFKGRKIK